MENDLHEALDGLIIRALSQRTDLLAKLAGLKASQAAKREACAAYYPKLSLDAGAGWSKLDISAFDSPFFGNSKPVYSAGLAFNLRVYHRDGLRNCQSLTGLPGAISFALVKRVRLPKIPPNGEEWMWAGGGRSQYPW